MMVASRSGPSAAQAVRSVAEVLARAGVPSPFADARWLVAEAAGYDPQRRPAELVPAASRSRLDALVDRRAARVPLQLVVGHTAFRTVEIACRHGVFIPRPETEVVAGLAIEAARASARRHGGSVAARAIGSRAPAGVVVVEPCTGTGAIACSLAAEVPGVRVVASDLSDEAVVLARHNVARLAAGTPDSGFAGRSGAVGRPGFAAGSVVEVAAGNLLDGVDPRLRGAVDVLVANPPYLPASDRDGWPPEVADHEPFDALAGGSDGHEVVDALLHLAVDWLAPGGTVVVEIDARRGAEALAVAGRAGLADARVARDLSGADRAVVARRPTAGKGPSRVRRRPAS